MTPFNEENTVEEFVRDLLCGKQSTGTRIGEPPPICEAGRSDPLNPPWRGEARLLPSPNRGGAGGGVWAGSLSRPSLCHASRRMSSWNHMSATPLPASNQPSPPSGIMHNPVF